MGKCRHGFEFTTWTLFWLVPATCGCIRLEFPRSTCVEERIAFESITTGDRLRDAPVLVGRANSLDGQTPREFLVANGELAGTTDSEGAFVVQVRGTRSVYDFQNDAFRPDYSVVVIGLDVMQTEHVVLIRMKTVSLIVPYAIGAGHAVIEEVQVDGDVTPLTWRFDVMTSMPVFDDPLLPGDAIFTDCGELQ